MCFVSNQSSGFDFIAAQGAAIGRGSHQQVALQSIPNVVGRM
jgi:hypothetical protein